MKAFKVFTFILSLFVIQSCYEKLDFNQVDDIIYTPVFTSSLTNFTILPSQFFNNQGIQQNTISDSTVFELFKNDLVQNDVFKIDFYAEIKNEFDRNITIYVRFLDDNNSVVYNFTPIQIQTNSLNNTFLEEIYLDQNPEVLNAAKVFIEVELENTGTQMNPNSTDEFELKSSVTAYIQSNF